MTTPEIKFKPVGHYLSRCHQWVGDPPPPGYLPGWSAHDSCWWVLLDGYGPFGGRWIIAGPTREGVERAMLEKINDHA